MEAGQQAKPIAEIQPTFRNLDIGQLVQGKTLTVGNLLDWQRTVIQGLENAKSGGAPISLIPVTTTFQPANVMRPIAPQIVTTVQSGPAVGIATSVPVIRATNAERMAVPESRPLTSMVSGSFAGQNMSGSVLNSMMHSVTSLMHPSGVRNEEAQARSPTSPHGLSVVVSKSSTVSKQPVVPSSINQQVTSNVTAATDAPTTSTEATQNASPAPPSKSLFKLSGRTLVTILPSGSGEGKNSSSHKIFGDDAFTPIDSYGAGAFEAGSPTSGDVKMTEKITLSPKGTSSNRVRNESTESNTNKNNNNSTASQSVKVKRESDYGNHGGTTPPSSKKGKTSSRGRNIKNTAVVYTETSDYDDDDVFIHSTCRQQKSSKSKRSARQTATITTTATNNNDVGESDQESMQQPYYILLLYPAFLVLFLLQ